LEILSRRIKEISEKVWKSLESEKFIKSAPENPVLWTGMKGVSAETRKKKQDAETSSA
jgi:hypothetical protein